MNGITNTISAISLAAIMAVSPIGVASTLQTSDNLFNVSLPYVFSQSPLESTSSITATKYDFFSNVRYLEATSIFGGEMRDFTAEESDQYRRSIDKAYKDTGISIFDL